MKRFKNLDLCQKCILLLLAVMLVVFTTIYSIASSREGFEYKDTMLYPSIDGNTTVYTGKLNGKKISFTVEENQGVTYQNGDKTYGPYMISEDPTAIPKDSPMAEHLTGIEIRTGDTIYFRGGMLVNTYGRRRLYGIGPFSNANDQGISYDIAGFDRMAPTPITILELSDDPKLTTFGDWGNWLSCALASVLLARGILFADEPSRKKLLGLIGERDNVAPSDQVRIIRYILWTSILVLMLIAYIDGLKL